MISKAPWKCSVFGKALAEYEAILTVDQIVLIRGRVDHKEAGKTCVVVQEAQSFKPTEQEIEQAHTQATVQAAHAQPVHLQMDATRLPASVIDELKEIISENPGSAEVVLEMATAAGARRLRLGEAYRVKHTPTLRAELEQILAQAISMSPASLAS